MLIFSLVYKKWVAFNIHLKQGSTDIFKINFLFIFLFFLYIVKFFAHSLSFVHCIVLRIFFFFFFPYVTSVHTKLLYANYALEWYYA